MTKAGVIAAACCLFITACGEKGRAVESTPESRSESVLADEAAKALDKAESVEALNREKKAAVDDTLRQAEEGRRP